MVTGAGRGIGLAAAQSLAGYGASVSLLARTRADVEKAAREIEADGGKAEAFAIDVEDIDAVERFLSERPAFDILVNNAGFNRTAPFLDVTREDFDAIIALNVRAAFFVAQAVARRMATEGVAGSIINMSSQMGHVGAANRSVYCASKWAMEGMTKAAAVDLAPQHIRINTICPTFVETPLASTFLNDPEFKKEVLSKIKLGRIGKVDDITGAVVFIASDASSLMTGSSIVVDGGWTAD
jgi:NAD(P)-dependent dehydrogenase (short-subunit alcohol dehydrogenase family)